MAPFLWNLLAQKSEGRVSELGACGMAFVVGDVYVHKTPEPLDGFHGQATGQYEVQPDAAAGLGQAVLHQSCVRIARMVQIDLEERHQRVVHLD